jgi:hypothetical protein
MPLIARNDFTDAVPEIRISKGVGKESRMPLPESRSVNASNKAFYMTFCMGNVNIGAPGPLTR